LAGRHAGRIDLFGKSSANDRCLRDGAVPVGLENVRNPSKLGDWVFTLKAGEQFLEQRAERLLLGLGQRQQESLLIGDMAADRLVDRALAWVSEHNQFAATVLGIGAAHHEPGAWQTPAPDSRQGYFK
jgi:hypothetical protein